MKHRHDGDAQPGELSFGEEATYQAVIGVSQKDERLSSVLWLLQLSHDGWVHRPVVLAQPLADEVATGG